MSFTICPWAYMPIRILECRKCIPVFFLLAFCHTLVQPVSATAGIEVTGSDGYAITLERPAESIVSLYGAFNEILLALDCGHLVKARTKADADIPQLAHLPSAGTHMRPNLELIAAAKPDVVLQMQGRHEALQDVQALRKLGIKTLVFEINSFAQLFETTQKLGLLTGSSNKARSLVDSWKKDLASLAERHKGKKKPAVFYEARYPNLLAAGGKGIVNEIIAAAGGENVVNLPKKLARINEEFLLATNPDVYIMQKGPMNPMPTPLENRSNFQSLKARAYIVDERIFSRPGPGSIKAAMELERLLYPEKGKEATGLNGQE